MPKSPMRMSKLSTQVVLHYRAQQSLTTSIAHPLSGIGRPLFVDDLSALCRQDIVGRTFYRQISVVLTVIAPCVAHPFSKVNRSASVGYEGLLVSRILSGTPCERAEQERNELAATDSKDDRVLGGEKQRKSLWEAFHLFSVVSVPSGPLQP